MAAEILNARVDYAEPLEAALESAKVFFILHIDHGEDRRWSVANLELDTPSKGRYSVDFEIRQSTGTWETERENLRRDRLEFATVAEGIRFACTEEGIKASYVMRKAHQDSDYLSQIDRTGLFILGSTTEVQGYSHFFRLASESGFGNGKESIGQRCFVHQENTGETLKRSVKYLAVRRRTSL